MKNPIILKLIRLLLIFSLIISCSDKEYDIELKYSSKNLHRIFYGNAYYKLKGINSKVNGLKYNLSRPAENLLLKSREKINDFNYGILLKDSISIFLNEHKTIPQYKKELKFNDYFDQTLYYSPSFRLDNLEIIGLRNSRILTVGENEEIYPYLSVIDEEIELSDLIFYQNNIDDILNLEKKGLYPSSLFDLKLIQNPFSNIYSIFPDLRYFTTKKNFIISDFTKNLKQFKKTSNPVKESYKILKDTIIEEDFIIRNKRLIVENNANIYLKADSRIIADDSEIDFNGSASDSIKIKGYGNNSILFRNCSQIKFKYCSFENLQNHESNQIVLPSAITFYNSYINISKSKFANNTQGDDYINFFYSKFDINESEFQNVLADAVDSDFSEGTISNTIFTEIGNDAIDLSGSSLNLLNLKLDNIKDKAISAGENSCVTLDEIKISNSEIAIVVKDGSIVKSQKINFSNNKINYCTFLKKSFYDYPTLIINDSIKIDKYLFEQFSNIEGLTSTIIFSEDVEKMLYGNIYGKSSK
jgi:hypothetical protein